MEFAEHGSWCFVHQDWTDEEEGSSVAVAFSRIMIRVEYSQGVS